jgi:hypothetical protein
MRHHVILLFFNRTKQAATIKFVAVFFFTDKMNKIFHSLRQLLPYITSYLCKKIKLNSIKTWNFWKKYHPNDASLLQMRG